MVNKAYRVQQNRQARLIGLFLAALFLFNFPLVGMFSHGEKWGSFPGIFLYIGLVWIALVIALYRTMRS